MIYSRSDIGDRQGSHIPVTVLALDEDEYDEVRRQLDFIDDTCGSSEEEYFVLCWSPEGQWVYERYGVIGGDIFFHRGPMPADVRCELPGQ